MPSRRRQFAGMRPDCDRARTAATPSPHDPKWTEAPPRQRGRTWTRTHASVTMPSAPSDPSRRRSGDGPAPEPGSRRDSLIPAGVTARIDSTRSSMWV